MAMQFTQARRAEAPNVANALAQQANIAAQLRRDDFGFNQAQLQREMDQWGMNLDTYDRQMQNWDREAGIAQQQYEADQARRSSMMSGGLGLLGAAGSLASPMGWAGLGAMALGGL